MKEFECDCGFKWLEGESREHNCGPFYMEKVDGLKQELGAAKAHIAELIGELEFFVDRVNSGTARSVTTYARFNAMLAKTPAQSLASIEAKAVLDYEASLSSFAWTAAEYNANKLLWDTK